MNKLNPIEDNIIEKNQSKQTPAKLELNNHQINRLKSGKILNNKKSLLNLMKKNFKVMKEILFHRHYLLITKLWLEDLLYHRPRGIFSAAQKSQCITEIGKMNTKNKCKATTIKLFEGLESRSQNHLGSLNFDLLAINDFLHPFLSAGFYYKTFMWPKSFGKNFMNPQ